MGGAVAEFMNDGKFVKQFAFDTTTSGRLQSPWGAAVLSMPKAAKAAGFGQFAPDVLVSNFSSGQIDAYNFKTGKFEGTLDAGGTPLVIPGLRTVHFGPGLGASGKTKIGLLFTADPFNGNNVSIYGEITPVTKLT